MNPAHVAEKGEHADLIRYPSSVTPGVVLAAVVHRPREPRPLRVTTHGWHMSAPWRPGAFPEPAEPFLTVHVDLRGRAHSTGSPDCNGLELWDVIDAAAAVRRLYPTLLTDLEQTYLSAGSGGGGNVFALINKFPDAFTAAAALYGISDYAEWYRGDGVGEFRDEMDVWIGSSPDERPDAYRARSGLHLCANQLTPLYVAHGDGDLRVPVEQSRAYVAKAQALGKPITYRELPGIGGRAHLSGYTPAEQKHLDAEVDAFLLGHHNRPNLPPHGRLVVGGYVATTAFTLRLESIDHCAEVRYDLTRTPVAIETEYSGAMTVNDHRM